MESVSSPNKGRRLSVGLSLSVKNSLEGSIETSNGGKERESQGPT